MKCSICTYLCLDFQKIEINNQKLFIQIQNEGVYFGSNLEINVILIVADANCIYTYLIYIRQKKFLSV